MAERIPRVHRLRRIRRIRRLTSSDGPIGPIEVAPINTTPPFITGSNIKGSLLTCDPGDWIGADSFAYQWYDDAVLEPGETNPTYQTAQNQGGHEITCEVTATNARGSTAVLTPEGVTLVNAPIPMQVGPGPTVLGSDIRGSELSVDEGNWVNTDTFTYQWTRAGAPIAAATNATYTTVLADQGFEIGVEVTGHNNDASSDPEPSDNTILVIPPIPVNTVAPTVSGDAAVGSLLTCSPGTWSDAVSFTYQWTRNGGDISGATSATYTSIAADVGTIVGCNVSASNATGTSDPVASSNTIAVVEPLELALMNENLTRTFTVVGTGTLNFALGGAGGGPLNTGTQSSGAGGFAVGELAVSNGDTVDIQVGQAGGGIVVTGEGRFGGWPDGGPGAHGDVTGAGGGGSTRIWKNGVLQAVAGAGGGVINWSVNAGAGGGASPGASNGGVAATQSAGGIAQTSHANKNGKQVTTINTPARTGGYGSQDGNAYTSTGDDGGGGGGGYYGGAGGGGDGRAGGGGSGWVGGADVSNGSTSGGGVTITPPTAMTTHEKYPGGNRSYGRAATTTLGGHDGWAHVWSTDVGLTSLYSPWLHGAVQGFKFFIEKNLSSLWQDTTALTPVTAVGQQVARWDDRSPNLNHLLQATLGLRPTLRFDRDRGSYYLEFTGAQMMQTAAFASALTQPGEIVCAAQVNGETQTIYDGIGASNRWRLFRQLNISTVWLKVTAGTEQFIDNTNHQNFGVGGKILSSVQFNGASSDARMNREDFRSPPSTDPFGITGNIGAQTLTGLTIGANHDGTEKLNGRVYSLCAKQGGFTSLERTAIENDLHNRGLLRLTSIAGGYA